MTGAFEALVGEIGLDRAAALIIALAAQEFGLAAIEAAPREFRERAERFFALLLEAKREQRRDNSERD